jgi:hypothetical protein
MLIIRKPGHAGRPLRREAFDLGLWCRLRPCALVDAQRRGLGRPVRLKGGGAWFRRRFVNAM